MPQDIWICDEFNRDKSAEVTDDRELRTISKIGSYSDETNPIRKDIEGGGKISVGTTAVEVTFTGTPTHAVIITADKDNSGTLFVGESNVLSDGSNALTFLERGDSIEIDYNDIDNALYVVSDTASQNFWKGAIL